MMILKKAEETLNKIFSILAADMEKVKIGSGKRFLEKVKADEQVYKTCIARLRSRERENSIISGEGIIVLDFESMQVKRGCLQFDDVKKVNRELQEITFESGRERLHSLIKAFIK